MSKYMNIIDLYNSFGEIKEPTWLDGRSYSDAFILCISSGPWRENRRFKIQNDAISFIAGRDLSEINNEIDFFPLAWQNNFTNSIIHYLQLSNHSMKDICIKIKKELIIKNNRQILYSFCKCPKGSKVLSLFCRDSLKISNCFTIDRHVRKFLQQHDLPITENEMVDLCLENGVSPRLFAIGVAQLAGIKNPDWSIK